MAELKSQLAHSQELYQILDDRINDSNTDHEGGGDDALSAAGYGSTHGGSTINSEGVPIVPPTSFSTMTGSTSMRLAKCRDPSKAAT